MLSMLMITPPKQRGAIAKSWRRIFPPPVEARLDSAGNAPFIKIICEEHPKGIDWRMVEAHSLEPSGRLLLPRGLECPAESELRRFVPTRFMRRMLENFALETLVSSEIPPSERSLAVYGSEAEVVRLLPRLIPLVGNLRIITRRAYAVKGIVDDTVKRTGMAICVTDEPDAGESTMLLAPFGGAGFITVRPDAAVIAPDRPKAECAAWVSSARVSVPPALEEAYDEAYDVTEFTGAFYELSGMLGLAGLFPDHGCCGKSRITAEELGKIISK